MHALPLTDRFRIPPGPQSRYRKLPVVGPVLDEVLTWLRHHGYTESTIRNHVKGLSCLMRWLQRRQGSVLKGLTQVDLGSAYEHFRGREPQAASATHALARFFRERQMIPEGKTVPSPASERELATYGTYLREMRGMAESTIVGYQNRLRFFLQFLKFDQHPWVLRTLRLDQIEAFLCWAAKVNNRFSLQHVVACLRGFLQRQHAQGVLQQPLHQQIDTPRTYRLEQLPRALPWPQVVALLRSVDHSQPHGLRDFTLLYLVAWYGLRSGEVVQLTLDDIDWRAGTLQVPQTKTRQILRLPLTDEAGVILTRYLKTARPRSSYRELFLRRIAPLGPLAPTAVGDILQARIGRSGLELPPVGAHALRHSLAVHLLRRGVALGAIGAVLGHRSPESTTVYLRLAVDDLRTVGLPVPKGGAPVVFKPQGWNVKLPRVLPPQAKPLGHADFRSGLAAALRGYLATRRALGRRYAAEEAVLRRWDDFLRNQFGQARQVRPEMFDRWAQRIPTQLTPIVRRNHMRIVRNFLLFYARRYPQTYLPNLATFPKPSPHRPPRLVSATEMARVLAAACQLPVSHYNPLRPQTIRLALLLLFCCGLRRGELLRLQWQHFDPQDNVLRVEATKFHKSRLVPLSKSVAQELRQYQELRRRRGLAVQPVDYLIWKDSPLASEQVYSATTLKCNWQRLCLGTGVLDERGRPPRLHDLRHSCAVTVLERWYRTGTDLHSKLPHLATYLGHVNPGCTHHYLHLTPQLQQAANRRFQDYARLMFSCRGAR